LAAKEKGGDYHELIQRRQCESKLALPASGEVCDCLHGRFLYGGRFAKKVRFTFSVAPAQAGIQLPRLMDRQLSGLDSRLRGNDGQVDRGII
jgi:hypothetical protein